MRIITMDINREVFSDHELQKTYSLDLRCGFDYSGHFEARQIALLKPRAEQIEGRLVSYPET